VVYWSGLELEDKSLRCAATHCSKDKGFIAITLVRRHLIAAISASHISWLRVDAKGLVVAATTNAYLPTVAACFPSHTTNELILICGDGMLGRVPIQV
jgi:hypothetical protein